MSVLSGVSIGDWVAIIVGLATIYYLKQANNISREQNEIFREQNEIFAAQAAGKPIPAPKVAVNRWLIYRPVIAILTIALLVWATLIYDAYDRNAPSSQWRPWWIAVLIDIGLLFAYSVYTHRRVLAFEKLRRLERSQLVADYLKEIEKLKSQISVLEEDLADTQRKAKASALKPMNDDEPIYTLAFDYLPTSPLEEGWRQEYMPDGVAEFLIDPEIPESLRIKIVKSEVAIHHDLPPHATRAEIVEFTAKYTNTTMVFTRLTVAGRDGRNVRNVDFKYYYGKVASVNPTRPNPNPGRDPNKWLPEQTLYWPAEPRPNGQLFFRIDLQEAVKLALGTQGWILKSIQGIRLRSNLSISPIVFKAATV